MGNLHDGRREPLSQPQPVTATSRSPLPLGALRSLPQKGSGEKRLAGREMLPRVNPANYARSTTMAGYYALITLVPGAPDVTSRGPLWGHFIWLNQKDAGAAGED